MSRPLASLIFSQFDLYSREGSNCSAPGACEKTAVTSRPLLPMTRPATKSSSRIPTLHLDRFHFFGVRSAAACGQQRCTKHARHPSCDCHAGSFALPAILMMLYKVARCAPGLRYDASCLNPDNRNCCRMLLPSFFRGGTPRTDKSCSAPCRNSALFPSDITETRPTCMDAGTFLSGFMPASCARRPSRSRALCRRRRNRRRYTDGIGR